MRRKKDFPAVFIAFPPRLAAAEEDGAVCAEWGVAAGVPSVKSSDATEGIAARGKYVAADRKPERRTAES